MKSFPPPDAAVNCQWNVAILFRISVKTAMIALLTLTPCGFHSQLPVISTIDLCVYLKYVLSRIPLQCKRKEVQKENDCRSQKGHEIYHRSFLNYVIVWKYRVSHSLSICRFVYHSVSMPNFNLTCIFYLYEMQCPYFGMYMYIPWVKNFQTTSNDIQGHKVTLTLTPLLRVISAGYGVYPEKFGKTHLVSYLFHWWKHNSGID